MTSTVEIGTAGHVGAGARRIFRATVVIAAVTALSRGLTAIREVLVAHQFGTSSAVDAILVGSVIPAAIAGVTFAAVSAAIVPRLISAEVREGPDAADALAVGVARLLAGAGVAASLVLLFGAPYIIDAFGLAGDVRSTAVASLRVIAPSVAATTLTAVWSSVLLARGRNLAATIGLLATPVLSVAAIVLLAPSRGIIVLAWAILIGSVVELTIASALARPGRAEVRHRRPTTTATPTAIPTATRATTPAARRAAMAVVPPLIAIGLVSCSMVSDQLFAARVGPGSVAILAYGSRVITLILVLGATSLGFAALPHFSQLVEGRRWTEVDRLLRLQRRAILAVSLVVIIVVVATSELMISLVFGHGRFSQADVSHAAAVQRMAVLQIPFYALWFLTSRVASALGRTRIQIVVSAAGLVTNITLDWWLSRWFGLPGIALASAGFQLVLCVGTAMVVRRELDRRLRDDVDAAVHDGLDLTPFGVADATGALA